jgi:MYXO-CTERM domain-containing protein
LTGPLATVRLVLVTLAGAALLVTGGDPAGAVKCTEAPAPDDATAAARSEVVFVGTVLSATDHGSVAEVKIEEVRKGPPQPDRVHVQGVGPLSSGHRLFTPGQRYVFYPRPLDQAGPGFDNDGGPFKEDACTATRLLAAGTGPPGEQASSDAAAAPVAANPESPAAPVPTIPGGSTAPDTSGGSSAPGWLYGAAALPLAVVGLLLHRRRAKATDSPEH